MASTGEEGSGWMLFGVCRAASWAGGVSRAAAATNRFVPSCTTSTGGAGNRDGRCSFNVSHQIIRPAKGRATQALHPVQCRRVVAGRALGRSEASTSIGGRSLPDGPPTPDNRDPIRGPGPGGDHGASVTRAVLPVAGGSETV